MLDAERNTLFESWIDAHKAILFKVARVFGATHADREDLFQEIALQVWHSVQAYRGDCAATTWIYRVALNTALAWRRKERRHSEGRQDIEAATGLLIEPSGRDPRLEWIYQRIAELDEVNRSLALLMLDGFQLPRDVADPRPRRKQRRYENQPHQGDACRPAGEGGARWTLTRCSTPGAPRPRTT